MRIKEWIDQSIPHDERNVSPSLRIPNISNPSSKVKTQQHSKNTGEPKSYNLNQVLHQPCLPSLPGQSPTFWFTVSSSMLSLIISTLKETG